MKQTIYKIKLLAALVLLVFLFLPIGSCQRKYVKPEVVVKAGQPAANPSTEVRSDTNVSPQADYLILIKIGVSEPLFWISIFTFFWPLLLVLVKRMTWKIRRSNKIINAFEVLLTVFSVYFVYSVVFRLWYKPTIWGYALVVIIGLYSLALLVETVLLYRSKVLLKTA